MSTVIYQPKTLQEVRDLVANDTRTKADYAVCVSPGNCVVARALQAAKQNRLLSGISVVPSTEGDEHVEYADNRGRWFHAPLNSVLNKIAMRFDNTGTFYQRKTREQCLEFLDQLIAEEAAK